MEKFIENLQEASKIIRTLDHMMYVTFPLIKDKNILLKILLETKTATVKCINSILQREYLYKRIRLYKNPKTNFKIFCDKCAKRYGITEQEIKLIFELFSLVEKHKQSSMEFAKNGKVIILSDRLDSKILTVENLKEFLILSKNILRKINETTRTKII